jgi:hypothetical protein
MSDQITYSLRAEDARNKVSLWLQQSTWITYILKAQQSQKQINSQFGIDITISHTHCTMHTFTQFLVSRYVDIYGITYILNEVKRKIRIPLYN